MEYNPLVAPHPEEWLELDEMERNTLVREYHERAGVKLPDQTMHATFHVIVENQLAEGLPDVVEALERLQNEGLDRHEAIHAIGSVLLEHIWKTVHAPDEFTETESYLKALRKLTKKSWLKKMKK
ncbi:hypothetical protein Calab_0840 [Caldithrix abyssi DSM 13497]|uniref:DUF1841 family protein n=1 Tax=Caldithrix abyssi DSM 13497 TaxID=880073 RepID=H1XU34_CALAY|nr:DUF1841 family protein [Caldithrix abyssi]APF16869.1 protein of unknown function (DUF1841) [Caldithrix abyssi DSM 13497]EHO40477.1 hypothetical protein Calab_0840 [Caldithrix abyssi DSM 13497]